jgi:2-methylisocitrate lyase-like PEP mutase family enzyme
MSTQVGSPASDDRPIEREMRLLAASGRLIRPGSPGGRVLQRLQAGHQLVFLGACTPFRNLILRDLGHHDAWFSSFELSALLGERDDESIGFREFRFFVDRIHRRCPEINIFMDCDTGWSDDPAELHDMFSQLAGSVAMVSIENILPGHKDNSFISSAEHHLASPEQMAARLEIIAAASTDTLITLRLENNVLGRPLQETLRYVRRLQELDAPFDCLLLHHKQRDVAPLIDFAREVARIDGSRACLVCVATAFMTELDLLNQLAGADFQVVVVPNYSTRYELSATRELYRALLEQEFEQVEQRAVGMGAVFDLIYGKNGWR